jgi:glycerol-3-phosphate dehydrogenase (NAD(P)+)
LGDPLPTEQIAVVGGGSWGTSLAHLLANKGYKVNLWVYEKNLVEEILKKGENTLYLPGIRLPSSITPTCSMQEALKSSNLMVFVVPSHVARKVLSQTLPYLPADLSIICATKGIENDTVMLMSQVIQDVLPPAYHSRLAVLSGPSFAKEVCLQHPTAVVLAVEDSTLSESLAKVFITHNFRVYTSRDMTGVQLGGALKNVIALAAGGVEGLGLGHNTRSALISRGLAEITRLGIAMGADPRTFAGLSGLGDLVLTCTGELSRNKTVGIKIGQGIKLPEILKQMRMVAEGVHTTKSAYQLSQKYGVRMPIVQQVYRVLFEDQDPREALSQLLEGAGGPE